MAGNEKTQSLETRIANQAVKAAIRERRKTMDVMYKAYAALPSAHNYRRLEIALREYQEIQKP